MVKHIELSKTVDGKTVNNEYPIYFSNYVFAQYEEATGKSLGKLMESLANPQNMRLNDVYELAYLSIKAGHKLDKKPFEYDDKELFYMTVLDQDPDWADKVFSMIEHFFPSPEPEAKEEKKSKPKAAKS